jgi:hypothetical protein
VVDAYAAQSADSSTRPFAVTMALVGLYLHNDKAWTAARCRKRT